MKPKIVVALDTELEKAKKIVDISLNMGFDIFKIGHFLFDTSSEILDYINKKKGKVILDLKFYDIPSVIVKAVGEIIKKYDIFAFTVHTLAGEEFLKEVMKFVSDIKNNHPVVFAVTILTSLDTNDLKKLGFRNSVEKQVLKLAGIAFNSKVNGVVCSPNEVKKIKNIFGEKFLTLVPGVSIDSFNVDQKRTNNLKDVIKTGADYIVIGRSIYQSKNFCETFSIIKNIL